MRKLVTHIQISRILKIFFYWICDTDYGYDKAVLKKGARDGDNLRSYTIYYVYDLSMKQ